MKRKRRSPKKLLALVQDDLGDCAKTDNCNAFDLFLWTGNDAGEPACVIETSDSYCYAGFRYTSWKALVSSELPFEVKARKGSVRFKEGDPADSRTWKGVFRGVKTYVTLDRRDEDQDLDRTELEVVEKGKDEFLEGVFHTPPQGTSTEGAEVELRLHVETAEA